ncbi:MAG: multidrug efflux RND transporter permease subunit [Desulfuromonadaceae bacterium]|nr:multidrug efflux RND transporter permease subunit [Desulfuromonadaceae bacterium]
MFSRFFIERPRFAAVISIVIVIAGLVVFNLLPVAMYPEITPPTVKVEAFYPGANARVLADTVAVPIEQEVNGVEQMLYMASTCSNNGSYSLTVTFKVGTDLDMAAVRVQNRVAIAESSLPEEVTRQGVTVSKESTNIVLIAALTSTDKRYDELFLSNYATLRVKDELSRLDGVGNVFIFGVGDYSMRIWLDPAKLKARGLTTTDVVSAIREQNVQVAAGQIGQPPAPPGQNFQYSVNTLGRLEEVAQFEEIILSSEPGEGRLLRVRDVARVELGAQNYDISSQLKGTPIVGLGVFQLPGANSLEVSRKVRAKMEELKQSFPPGMDYRVPFDTTGYISASIREVLITIFIAAVLVILTILLFLEDWRATLIPAAAIPVSLIGTFAFMGVLGFSINTLSLFGIVLAIGVVVDDAILVVENTARNITENRLPPKEAAIRAMEEVTGPVIATTLVLLAVFVPTAFLGGITGQLYRQFALTISAATVFSSINALTLSPSLCAIFLRQPREKRNWFVRLFNRGYERSAAVYQKSLALVMRRMAVMVILFLALGAATFFGYLNIPTGFVPPEDQGWAIVFAQLPDAASKQRTEAVVAEINQRFARIEGIESWVSVPGFSLLDGGVAANAATFWVVFDPWEKRRASHLSQEALIGRMWQEFYTIQEAAIIPFVPPPIMGLGESGGFQMMLQDRGGVGFDALQEMLGMVVRDANARPGLQTVYSTFRANVPQIFVDVDRTKAKTLGVPLSSVFETLQAYLGSAYVNDFNKFGRSYQVKVQAEPEFRASLEDIRRLEVRNNQGGMLPLGTLVSVKDAFGPQVISRYNLYPAAAVNGSAAPGVSSGEALNRMEEVVRARLPSSMGFEWTGISYQEKAVGGEAVFIFLLAVVFVYLTLCAQYESWMIPVAVILSVPLAIFGTMAALMIRGLDINVYTQIGMVLLVALASKSSILIVEFAKEIHTSGKGAVEAALEAARLRFRPILMTAFTFILGVFPLIVATGAGAAARRALGTAVFAGMISATLLTIFFVPVFYVLVQKIRDFGKSKGTGGEKGEGPHNSPKA